MSSILHILPHEVFVCDDLPEYGLPVKYANHNERGEQPPTSAHEPSAPSIDPEDETALRAALSHNPDDPILWANLGRLLRQRQQSEEALNCYRRATGYASAPAGVWFNLGNALYDQGDHAAALAAFDSALQRQADLPGAQLQRARCLTGLGQLAQARDSYQALLADHPTDFNAWLELGNVRRKLGLPQEAIDAYQQAAGCRPDDRRAHLAAARALGALGAAEPSAVHYHRAVVLCAGDTVTLAELHHQMGRFRLDDGDAPRALEALRQAMLVARLAGERMALDAQCEIRIDLADALMRLGLMDDARVVIRQAAGAQAEATLDRLSQTAFRFNEWQWALAILRHNVALHPDSASAWFKLAQLLSECALLEEALTTLDQAEARGPLPEAAGLRSAIASRSGDADSALAHYCALANGDGPEANTMRSRAAMNSLYSDTLTPAQVAALHRQLCAPLGEGARSRDDFPNPKTLDRPLRVGLVTADFHHQHPVNIFFQPLLARWDHQRFPLTSYFVGVSHDDQTGLAKARCDQWREMTHATLEQFRRQVADDQIDILFDLGGHTGQQRMAYFAQRLAPVQVTFLGYPGSTGCPNMDWLLGDPWVTPSAQDALCSERVWRLPHTVFCYAPEQDYPLLTLGDEAASRPLTFASFNNISKVTPHSVKLWAAILNNLPQARLLLKSPSFADPLAQRRYRELFAAQGVTAERLLFRGPTPLAEMMQEYQEVDIALDPVPYNGGTTTLQAMWMGVPVVVKAGGHFVARMGGSFMTAAGLADWVAQSDEEYVAIATRMGMNRSGLLALKRQLRAQLLSKPAWDIEGYSRDFHGALVGMWQQWCGE